MVTNIEKFNKCAAELFGLLYENFPIGTDIKINQFPEYNNPENSEIFFIFLVKFFLSVIPPKQDQVLP